MHRFFKRIMISVFILLFVMLALITISEINFYNSIENAIVQDHKNRLENAIEMTDLRIQEMEQSIMRIMFNEELNSISKLSMPLNTGDYYTLRDFSTELYNYNVINDFVSEYYIYFNQPGILMAPQTTSIRPQLFFESNMRHMNMAYTTWLDKIGQAYHDFTYWGVLDDPEISPKDCLTCLKSFPLGSKGSYKGVFVMNIDIDKINQYLFDDEPERGSWFFITDYDDNVILSRGISQRIETVIQDAKQYGYKNHEMTIDEGNVHVLSAKSEKMGWRYYMGVPSDEIEVRMTSAKNVLYFTLGVLFLIAIAGGIYISYYNSRPVIAFANRISGKMNTKDMGKDLSAIERSVNDLIRNNNTMQHELAMQTPMLKAILVERLLNGRFNSPEEMQNALTYIDPAIQMDMYVVAAIMSVTNYQDPEVLSKQIVVATNAVKEGIDETTIIQSVDIYDVAILVVTKQPDSMKAKLEQTFGDIQSSLNADVGIEVRFSVGRSYFGLVNLHNTYEEANMLKAIDGAMVRNIAFYDDIIEDDDYFYYPYELESKILYLAKSGRFKEIKHIMEELLIKNTQNVMLTNYARKTLGHLMRGTLMRVLNNVRLSENDESRMQEVMKDYGKRKSIRRIIHTIQCAYEIVCQAVDQNKKSHNTKMTEHLLRYIDEHFNNPDLMLHHLAEHFNLSKQYLCTFFTEQVGVTFTKYLERKRMAHAVKLLERGDVHIADICAEVGYVNKSTFYKAFKRIYGVSPSNYGK